MNPTTQNKFIELKSKMYELMSELGTGHNEKWYHQLLQSIHWLDTAIKNLPAPQTTDKALAQQSKRGNTNDKSEMGSEWLKTGEPRKGEGEK